MESDGCVLECNAVFVFVELEVMTVSIERGPMADFLSTWELRP